MNCFTIMPLGAGDVVKGFNDEGNVMLAEKHAAGYWTIWWWADAAEMRRGKEVATMELGGINTVAETLAYMAQHLAG